MKRGNALSRADIARELRLSRATAGHAVAALLSAGLALETVDNTPESRVGRPGVDIALNPAGAYSIGIEIGMRSVSGVIVDLSLQVIARYSVITTNEFHLPDIIVERTFEVIAKLLGKANVEASRILGVCVAVPGLVDKQGVVVNAPFLGWRQYDLRSRITDRCPADWLVSIQNDAAAFAVAECISSDREDADNLLMLLLSEGIGGALVQQGKVFEGARGYAGELGHMVLTSNGRTDSFEMLAGAALLERFFNTNSTIADAAIDLWNKRSTPPVAALLETWASSLAIGLANAVHLLDPSHIVIGGPLSLLYPAVASKVTHDLDSALIYGFIAPPIRVASFGADGAMIGAAATIRETVFRIPTIANN